MQKLDYRLTETVTKGGCAAKLPAGELGQFLKKLSLNRPPELKVGAELLDDACLWDLGNGQQLVQTLDFFTPIVDDPYEYGAIAATNAISDVYAMGGRPKIALTILGFPAAHLPLELLEPLMKGAIDKIHEAGACLAGGHTIDDETLKLGFSVTGFVEQGQAWTNAGARPGDVLILTKALGTGTITTALKLREAPESVIRSAIESMMTLNAAPELLRGIPVHAATDITGFGLAGHAMQMARASQVSFRISMGRVPALEGAMSLLEEEYLNRAHRTNDAYVRSGVRYEESVPAAWRWLTVDPQTSGGLLMSVPQEFASAALDRLKSKFHCVMRIGRVVVKEEESSVVFLEGDRE